MLERKTMSMKRIRAHPALLRELYKALA